jgi:hypothetical protein
MVDYIRDLRLAKWGLGVSLHGSNLEPPMSALGQKQTFAKADQCPLCSQKQTSPSSRSMSALCQKQTYAVRQIPAYSITASAIAGTSTELKTRGLSLS